MNRKTAKQLRSLFEERVTAAPLSMVRDREAEVPPGCIVFRKEMGQRTAFIAVIIAPMDDLFTIECAWSTDGNFPAYVLCSIPVDCPEADLVADVPTDGSFRFRLSSLWEPTKDPWWGIPRDQSKASVFDSDDGLAPIRSNRPTVFDGSVAEAVGNAIESILKHAVPYVEAKLQAKWQ